MHYSVIFEQRNERKQGNFDQNDQTRNFFFSYVSMYVCMYVYMNVCMCRHRQGGRGKWQDMVGICREGQAKAGQEA